METVWVFNGQIGKFSGGVFSELPNAENWIKENRLSGILTAYPLDKGVFDWALENDLLPMKQEKIEEKSKDSSFIASFTTATQEHYHYENGSRQG